MTRFYLTPRYLAAASAFALLGASPALADPSGFLSIGGGIDGVSYAFDGDSESFDGSAVQLLASGVYMFTPTLGAQGDVVVGWREHDLNGATLDSNHIDGALHGFYREADRFLVGSFFQVGRDEQSVESFELNVSRKYAGAEAQVYLDNLTLYGQAGWQQMQQEISTFDIKADGFFGSFEARYFLTPDLRIDGHIGVSTWEQSIPIDVTLTTVNLGIGAEYKLENLPISLFASYDYYTSTYDQTFAPTIDRHRLLVGAKIAIGEDSLLDRDRNGASLKPVDAPFFGPGFSTAP